MHKKCHFFILIFFISEAEEEASRSSGGRQGPSQPSEDPPAFRPPPAFNQPTGDGCQPGPSRKRHTGPADDAPSAKRARPVVIAEVSTSTEDLPVAPLPSTADVSTSTVDLNVGTQPAEGLAEPVPAQGAPPAPEPTSQAPPASPAASAALMEGRIPPPQPPSDASPAPSFAGPVRRPRRRLHIVRSPADIEAQNALVLQYVELQDQLRDQGQQRQLRRSTRQRRMVDRLQVGTLDRERGQKYVEKW